MGATPVKEAPLSPRIVSTTSVVVDFLGVAMKTEEHAVVA
jgi:hypothetical protein